MLRLKTSFKSPSLIFPARQSHSPLDNKSKEHNIETALQCYGIDYTVSLEDTRVDPDIGTHIRQCLHNDPDLSEWDEDIKLEIATTLISGARGI